MSAGDAELVGRVLDAVQRRTPVVAVIGDLLLDRWVSGRVERVSREAPAPVVAVEARVDVPGGAANTAMNLAALGARVRVVGAVGADANGDRLLELLEAAGVDIAGVVRVPGFRTTAKTRVSGGGQVLVRVDEGDAAGPEVCAAVAERVAEATAGVDAEIVCDYDIGTIRGAVRDALVARAFRPAVTVVDAHDLAPWAPLGPTAVTPNAAEVARLLGAPLPADRPSGVVAAAVRLLAATGAAGVVATLDREGAVVVTPTGTSRTWTRPAPEANASGAGDTFAAALVLALSMREALPDAARVAQLAADVVVRSPGTGVCTAVALRRSLDRGAALLDGPALVAALERERTAGRRIVFTNGAFDVLHTGHTAYLKQAAGLGDVLVVAVNDDDSVRRLKGPERPVHGVADRAGVLAELACVDYVTVFGSDTAIPLIEALRPDVYAKGGDYLPEMLEETPVVRAVGGEVRILDWVSPRSRSAELARVQALAPESDVDA